MNTEELLELLKGLYGEQDEQMRAQFQRSMSFQDGLFDRWERAKRLGFAEGASIYNSALVFGVVRVGCQTWIGPYTLLDGTGGGLSIGAYCSIASGVHVYTHDTVRWALSGGQEPKHIAAVTIGNYVYVGPQSVIVAGVRIGEKCVISANSFVNKNVESNTVVAGTPARQIGSVLGNGKDVRIVFDKES